MSAQRTLDTWQSFTDVDELPAARWLAYAIAEVGRDRLEGARVYLAEWEALKNCGVEAKFRRELLAKTELPDAEPMGHMRAWHAGEPRAALILVGAYGTAKSYAAAWWVLQRIRAGKFVHWESMASWSSLSFDEFRALRKVLESKHALILDDIGAAGMSKLALEHFEGILMARHAAGLPTFAGLNADRAQFMKLFGPRVIDRMKEGGRIVSLKSPKSLRGTCDELHKDADGKGRPRAWHWACWAMDVAGVQMVSRGLDDGSYEEVSVFCEQLARRMPTSESKPGTYAENWLDELERLRRHLRLPVGLVVESAKALATKGSSSPMATLAETTLSSMRAASATERGRRLASQRARAAPRGAVFVFHPERLTTLAPEGYDVPNLSHQELTALGVRFMPSKLDGIEVRHDPRAKMPKGEQRALKAVGFTTSNEAMAWACTLFATLAEVAVIKPVKMTRAQLDRANAVKTTPPRTRRDP